MYFSDAVVGCLFNGVFYPTLLPVDVEKLFNNFLTHSDNMDHVFDFFSFK